MKTEINPKPIIGRALVETQTLIKFLALSEVGKIITYKELNDVAKCDVQARNTVLSTARRTLSKAPHNIVFGTVMGIGVKRLSDEEIPAVGASAVKRSHRIAKRGMMAMNCAKPENMTEETKVRFFTSKTILGLFGGLGSRKTLHLAEQSARISNGSMNIGDVSNLFAK